MGRVLGAFGIKGELRLRSFSQDQQGVLHNPELWIGPNPESVQPFTPLSWRQHSGGLLVKAEQVQTREQAAALSGQWLFAPRSSLPPLPPGEYYWADLKGASVYDLAGRLLGQVQRVEDWGANDGLVVRSEDGLEAMLPMVEPLLVSFDLDQGRIIMDLPPGLLESQGWAEDTADALTVSTQRSLTEERDGS